MGDPAHIVPRLPPRLAVLLAGALSAAALLSAAPAGAADVVPGEVVVTPQAPAASASSAQAASSSPPVTVRTRPGESVDHAVARLRRTPGVAGAVPNYVAHAASTSTAPVPVAPPTAAPAVPWIPNDPGRHTAVSGWARVQWDFAGPFGVGAPQAWGNLIAAGRPGGKGVTVAVLDSGVAYTTRGGSEQSPDLSPGTFLRGYDFVDHDDLPTDRNGHGTHVASTIAEATNNGIGLTGLAYGAKILPVRVLDDRGEGDASTIARGVRYAVQRGADIINLSLEFSDTEDPIKASSIPQLISALKYANQRGVLVVAASGNEGDDSISYPAKAPSVVAVGATTEHGCLSSFSNTGKGLSLVAPGGGRDAFDTHNGLCDPTGKAGRDISQVTLMGAHPRRFGIPGDYEGTSMAAPHVSAAAALVIASGVIGPHPTPAAILKRLEATATDLGPTGYDTDYGFGLLNAAKATTPVAAR